MLISSFLCNIARKIYFPVLPIPDHGRFGFRSAPRDRRVCASAVWRNRGSRVKSLFDSLSAAALLLLQEGSVRGGLAARIIVAENPDLGSV